MRMPWIACGAIIAGLGLAVAAPPYRPLPALSDMPEIVSHDGVLSATLTAQAAKSHFGGVEVDTIVYNGSFAGPVLRVRPGDTMRIRLENRLTEPTNLHFHGIQTSPRGNSDNVHISVPPGQDFDYEIKIPSYQPAGAYWYHAHLHGLAEKQVGRGLSGALIVEGFTDGVPGLAGINERLFSLKSIEIEDSADPIIADEWHGVVQTINGAITVNETLRPHETVLWHLTNHDANQTVHLSLEGHHFTIVGRDGAAIPTAMEAEVLDIGPAARVEVLVTAGEPGDYKFATRNVLTGKGPTLSRNRIMGHLVVEGTPAISAEATLPAVADLSGAKVTGYRTFIFSQSKDAEQYYINGRQFDAGRMDTRVNLGDVEDWTIRNDSDDMHAFHIHQLSFQVMAVNGKPIPFGGLLDTVRVPEHGEITVRLPFTQPNIVGIFMYHCHVLKHEDKGMMQMIEVVDPGAAKHTDNGLVRWLASITKPAAMDIPLCTAGGSG